MRPFAHPPPPPLLSTSSFGSSSTDMTGDCTHNNNNNNKKKKKQNRLFVATHLVRAQSAYKDIKIHSFRHTHTHTHTRTHARTHIHTHARTHTHTLQIHALLAMGWYNEKEMTDQYSKEKGWKMPSAKSRCRCANSKNWFTTSFLQPLP